MGLRWIAFSRRIFRTVFEDFHRFRKLNWLTRPSIVNLIFEVLAIAHRRRGPWA